MTAPSPRCRSKALFYRLALYLLPPASWLAIRGWGRLSVQRAGKRGKCPILPITPRSVSTQETAAEKNWKASWTLTLRSTSSTRPQLEEAVLNGLFAESPLPPFFFPRLSSYFPSFLMRESLKELEMGKLQSPLVSQSTFDLQGLKFSNMD
jgi:hypothetical protein